MINQILWWDHKVFEWIQGCFQDSWINYIFIFSRDKMAWVPLYIFIFFWILLQFRSKTWLIVFSVLLMITISDQFNSSILKKNFKRERPCRELYFKDHFEPLIHCSGGYSFPSSHAANHAAMGIFFFLLFADSLKRVKYIFLMWPVLVGFSQVYVGVHFPVDILVGWLVGLIIGTAIYFLYQKVMRWVNRNRTIQM